MAVHSAELEPASDPPMQAAAARGTLNVPVAAPDEPAGAVWERIRGVAFDCAEEVVVVDDDDRLVGLVSIERLLAAPKHAALRDVMDADPPAVAPDADQELAAHRMLEHGESSLALVDDAGRFRGLVSPQAMLEVLIEEHEEDLARLGGYIAGSRRARRAAQEPVAQRLIHRLPWLLIGLVGAMCSAVLVGAFEEELSTNVLLAFFVPGLVYMADAVGTQTETVLIRAMAAGVSARSVLARELLTGLVVGVVIGVAFLGFALVGWGEADVALAVGVALFASCSIATVVAIVLPAVIQRLGRDPAFGSGPLATVIQDLLSIAVYFAVIVAFVS